MKRSSTDPLSTLVAYEEWIFDLDNTIYEETDYLFPAYRTIGAFCEGRELAGEEAVFRFLTETFGQEGRKELFNKLVGRFGLPVEVLPHFLEILRTNTLTEKIAPYPYFRELLQRPAAQRGRLTVITNGNVRQQKNKVALIDWGGRRDELTVLYANDFAPKPSPLAFEHWSREKKRGRAVYVGDAETDRQFAENCGIDFLWAHAFRVVTE